MITLDTAKSCTSANAMLERALRVATFYGFVPFEEAPKGERAIVSGRQFKFDPKDVRFVRREERRLVPTLKVCALRGLGDRRMPALLYKLTQGDRGSNQVIFELHAIGMRTAAAEALLITVADAIAAELGIESRVIHINSIGVGESADRYLRELTSFLRKNIEHLNTTQRDRMQTDPLGAFLSLTGKAQAITTRAPSSMDYLNEEERRHFWDVLEYLELADKMYELNAAVVGSSDCWAHTLFEISRPARVGSDEVGRVPFALGGRYDTLAEKTIGPGSSAVHVGLTFDMKTLPQVKRARWKPTAYLAHLGIEAKRRSIPVLEILRQGDIPVFHSLAYDQLAPQMAVVKRLNLPWLLIMGHKEALANEISVRNIKTNAQDAVPLTDLVAFLNRHHVAA